MILGSVDVMVYPEVGKEYASVTEELASQFLLEPDYSLMTE